MLQVVLAAEVTDGIETLRFSGRTVGTFGRMDRAENNDVESASVGVNLVYSTR
jgi:hypothetical protein